MKNNEEFIKDIYKKYNAYQKEEKSKKETKKYKVIPKITGIAAIAALIILTVTNFVNAPTREIENPTIANDLKMEEISLATVDNFENLYDLLKDISKDNAGDTVYIDGVKENAVEDTAQSATKSDTDYSKTNTQEENVDEGDMAKTDGKYIYTISNQKVVIVDIQDPNNMKVVSKIEYENTKLMPSQLYINKDKLIVIGGEFPTVISNTQTKEKFIEDVSEGIKLQSAIAIYDIQNRAEPKEIRRIKVEGSFLSSRMIGDNVYFAVNKSINTYPIARYDCKEIEPQDFQPKYQDTISGEEKAVEYSKIYHFENIQSPNYLILGGFNLNNTEEVEIKTFLGAGETVYCSEENMYIVKTSNEMNNRTHEITGSNTQILKFALNNGKINYNAETKIDGYINNQFSMSEKDGYFRIATTNGIMWNLTDETTNTLYVLNDKLEQVGKLEGLAKGEKIYSVRYVDDKAYIVTFKEIDPLFVIDLSNPSKPKVLGELKIPGYSTYLHPYDENHIIGFGYDTKGDGTRITTNGLKMVMFDTTDLSNPKELFKVNIGDRYTSSDLTFDHKALLYMKDKNLIAFPIIKYSRKTEYKGLIYKIDLQQGFILDGEISITSSKSNYNPIKRLIYANDEIFAISYNQIKTYKTGSTIEL